MPFSLQASEAYVLGHGLPWQVAFWKAAFGYGPVESLLFELERYQNPDGGWAHGLDPLHSGSTSSIESTLLALRLMATLNLGEDLFAFWDRTVAFLVASQADDGAWDEPAGFEAAGARAWERKAPQTLWYTAAVASYLQHAGAAPEAVGRAAGWVLARAPELRLERPFRWLALPLLAGVTGPAARALEAECRAGVAALVADDEDAADADELAWIHEALRMAAPRAEDGSREAAARRLESTQQANGAWADYLDPVTTCIFASRALVGR